MIAARRPAPDEDTIVGSPYGDNFPPRDTGPGFLYANARESLQNEAGPEVFSGRCRFRGGPFVEGV